MPAKIYQMINPRWPVSARRFACLDAAPAYDGAVSLTVLTDVREPRVVQSPQGARTIVGEGFHWVQLAPRGERWWLTAMFDETLRLVEFYFDITFENHILPDGGSWCRDAYIDVVINPDGTAHVLDEEELAQAFAAGEITREAYEQALADAQSVIARFQGQAAALETLCRGYLEVLLPRLPD